MSEVNKILKKTMMHMKYHLEVNLYNKIRHIATTIYQCDWDIVCLSYLEM